MILRYAAFTDDPRGGNPAGVVLDAAGLDASDMQRIAAEVGYSESAFVVARGVGEYDVRYFSPEAEVPFCGHATIATAVALAQRDGPGRLVFHTAAGPVEVEATGERATLTSVAPTVEDAPDNLVDGVLSSLAWTRAELDGSLPPSVAFAGARHLILAAATRDRLRRLDYDFDTLKTLMLANDLTTIALVWRADARTFHARNPFPVGGVMEDPATGAAAAAFGAYLRQLDGSGGTITVHQGEDLGRPSLLSVEIPRDDPRIRVSGEAVPI